MFVKFITTEPNYQDFIVNVNKCDERLVQVTLDLALKRASTMVLQAGIADPVATYLGVRHGLLRAAKVG